MIKAWSYTEEYKSLRKKILRSIDKTLKNGIFSLPLYPDLKVRELLRITKILKGILKHI